MFLLYVIIVSNIKLCTSVSVDMFLFVVGMYLPKGIMLAFMYRCVYTVCVCIHTYTCMFIWVYTCGCMCMCVMCGG